MYRIDRNFFDKPSGPLQFTSYMPGYPIVTAEEMRELEAEAERQWSITSAMLMDGAGASAADILTHHLLPHQDIKNLKVLLLIGPGNNGGDGMVMARYLAQAGAIVSHYRWKERKLTINGQKISEAEIEAELEAQINHTDYIIDALLGTGRSRPLPDDLRMLLRRVQEVRRWRWNSLRIVALDLPTGLNADTGEVDPGTIPADMTITMAYPKRGFFFFPGRDYIGNLQIAHIGFPEELPSSWCIEMITGKQIYTLLPHRPLNSNKGTFGKVMLFCGSPPYPGSAYLAGAAAARIGGGLITLAVTENMLPIYASSFHESTFVLLPAEEAGSFERAQALISRLQGYATLLIGPGLGQSANTREVILQILEYLRSQPEDKRPRLVIDADGLNNLSALEHWWTLLPKDTVITPHPGEMGRLCLGTKVSGGSIERLDLARQKAQKWQVNLVLKGACTIIAEPQGHTRINWRGNPLLATAGTGDVLAGMIAGLLAQGMQPFDAASAGVYLHTVAADLVAQEMKLGRTGLLASDLLSQLPRAMIYSEHAEI